MSFRRLRAYFTAAAQYKSQRKVRKERRRTGDLDEIPEPEPRVPPNSSENRDLIDAMRSGSTTEPPAV